MTVDVVRMSNLQQPTEHQSKTNETHHQYVLTIINLSHAAEIPKHRHQSESTVMGVMKMGNTVSRVGLEPTYLAFQASVLPFHCIGSLLSPLYPRPPVCVWLLVSEVSADYYTRPLGFVSLQLHTYRQCPYMW